MKTLKRIIEENSHIQRKLKETTVNVSHNYNKNRPTTLTLNFIQFNGISKYYIIYSLESSDFLKLKTKKHSFELNRIFS